MKGKDIKFERYPYDVMGRWPKIGLVVGEAKNNSTLETAIKDALKPIDPDPTNFINELKDRGISKDDVQAFLDDIEPYYEFDLAQQNWYVDQAWE